ncbi:hypothetical protein A3860_31660 [Niastella vici]|uniref:Outer membrane protein beta-barrel domain-containing protein n=1 Tax=Niastella vici TaxID=1703345 RepID=A0A1V9FTC0_9BACT|nr:outer membrane beta-barrel protein [Niastella vici]OQP61486.1 hypothetical protein A3860_31660 [Niastella vici]
MSDHEFEKQVHQKLEELKLRPSDTVWMEVEKNIRQDKRRRRFLWLWIPGIFIFLTTSAYLLYRYTNNQPATIAQAVPVLSNQTIAESSTNSTQTTTPIQPASQNNLPASGNAATRSLPQTQETKAASVTAVPTDQQPAIAVTSTNATNRKETIGFHNKKAVHKPQTAYDLEMGSFVSRPNKVNTHKKSGNRKRDAVQPVAVNHSENVQQPLMATTEAAQQEQHELTATVPAKAIEAERSIVTNKAAVTPFNTQSLLLAPDSAGSHTATATPIQRNRPSLWHWGVVTDAGYSRISENKLFQLRGLLGKDKYLAEDLSARSDVPGTNSSAFINYQGSSTSAAASKKTASPIQADFSFSAGVFVQRTLSPRLKLSLGLEYSYMSVNTQVGQKVDAPIVVNMGTSMVDTVRQYYKIPGYEGSGVNGSNYQSTFYSQTYRYRFHYIEIPLTVNWQVNKGRRLPPIVFEGGVSYARLLTVNALHYEGIKGVYYQNDDLFNKTQFNFLTGLSVGLLQRSKHPIWIGPTLRYSLNGLVKKEVSTGQYLWSTGISVKMSLGRL